MGDNRKRVENPIIVPLDGMTKGKALTVAGKLSGQVWGFKVNDLLIECGVSIITTLKECGKVFADPKLHDIPNTVANSAKKLYEAGADFITVHASGGIEMMMAASKSVADGSQLLAVTILTSLDEDTTHLIYGAPVKAKVLQLARDAIVAMMDGIVCSAQELRMLRAYPELRNLIRVTPGIRPDWTQVGVDDQKRQMTPKEAIGLGADYLVIGRPITQAKDPLEAVEKTLTEIKEAREEMDKGK